MTITALPDPPSRADPANFSTEADAFLGALPTFVTEANALAVAMNLNDTTATSATSLTVGTGTQTLTVDTGKSYQPGMSVKIAYTTDPTNWMHGDVVSYNAETGALEVYVTTTSGSGTQTAWTITFSAPVEKIIGPQGIDNLSIAASVSAKALTVALKGRDGNDPSSSNIVRIAFRNATIATGDYVVRTVTGALSVVLSDGSTLGFDAAEAGRIYVWAIDNAGTVVLGLSRTADIFPESDLVSTTAEGGAGAADSETVMYSTAAQASKAARCIGYIEITTGAVAGEWDNAPTKIQIMGPGVRRTGDIVQVVNYQTGAVATGTTLMPVDDTIPQNTEGDEYMTLAITPRNAANKLLIQVVFNGAGGTADYFGVALFQDAVANALAAVIRLQDVANRPIPHVFSHYMTAGTGSEITFKVRAGCNGAGTTTFNGNAGSRFYGGVIASSITITEINA